MTRDGRVLIGLILEENKNALTVQTSNDTVVVPRSEILTRRLDDTSVMPEGVLELLKERELRSLFAYLASPQQTPLVATEENIATFFNGKDLTGWTGNRELWSVEDGAIVGKSNGLKRNEFLRGELILGDFQLKMKVLLVGNLGNSGIQFRSRESHDGHVKGYQADIGIGWWGKLYEEEGRGLLWKESGDQHVKPGKWNDYEIVAVGEWVRTFINGKLCVDLKDPEGDRRGIIAIQLHSGEPTEVRFKDFELKLLIPSSP